ncbi:hypothetical protein HP548_02510 [Paenibacillus taichungensis]|uniref:LA2681-like HEPN domain-containing protein n=1 Tax=Paenibacillus taichungensis TaxID=484184 RepID=A0ABX2MIG0_9BACL|nr:hypothetical protein [Paenibacillus taichungensis]NUU52967.1 hypothetical protein [Paenibacillus taichungensis]
MTFVSVNKNLMNNHLSESQLRKLINIYYGDKVKYDDLGEFEQGLYDFLKEEFPSPERLKLALAEVTQSGDLSKDFFDMAIGFQNAAVEIASFLLEEKKNAYLDTFIFPMTYLYRQALELLLKSLYYQEIKTSSDRISFIQRTRHDLSSLYNEILSLSINKDHEKKGYTWLSEFFRNISIFDQMSDSFRYPFKFEKVEDVFDEKLTMKNIFEERRDVDLIKLSNKFILAFALIKRLFEETTITPDEISYTENLEDFIENPGYSTEFLEEGGGYKQKSVFGNDYKRITINRFADAYSECATHLYQKHVENLAANSIRDFNSFFAVCYLFRNAIELSLKGLSMKLLDKDEAIKLIRSKKHNLYWLWKATQTKHCEGPMSSINIPHPEQIEFYVKLIHEVDASSSRFRYPADNELNSYYPDPYRYHWGIHYYLLSTCFERLRNTEYIIDDELESREESRRDVQI